MLSELLSKLPERRRFWDKSPPPLIPAKAGIQTEMSSCSNNIATDIRQTKRIYRKRANPAHTAPTMAATAAIHAAISVLRERLLSRRLSQSMTSLYRGESVPPYLPSESSLLTRLSPSLSSSAHDSFLAIAEIPLAPHVDGGRIATQSRFLWNTMANRFRPSAASPRAFVT